MHPTQLLHSAIPEGEREPLPCAAIDWVCCVTGDTGPAIPRPHLFGSSFCDQAVLRAPESPMVSVAAWVALKYRWERMSSWLCDGEEFIRLDRQSVRTHVLEGVDKTRWSGYITTSYKKHGSLRAPVNSGRRQVWLFEMRLVDCSDRARVAEWWRVMTQAQLDGVSRTSQESLDMPPGIIKIVGIPVWEAFRSWARDKWQSPLYQLLCYLLPSKEELKNPQEPRKRAKAKEVPAPAENAVETPPKAAAEVYGQLDLFGGDV